jgi:pyruvate dehydrogenase E2 component (dihydrolipoamide acetyltransferase)
MEAIARRGPGLRDFDERVEPVRGVTMRWRVGGSGPPLILVHGLGGVGANWAALVPPLAARRRVLVLDLPGHGRSAPLPAACGLASFADRVVLVAEREGMLPAAIAGHSLGGAVCVRLALRRPDAARALALFAPAGLLSFPAWRRGAMAAARALRPAEAWLARNRDEVALRPRLKRLAFGVWGAVHPAGMLPDAVVGLLEGSGLATDTLTARRALIAERCADDLATLRCPALLVWGARDRLVPLDVGFEYAQRLGAPLRVLPAAGHLLIGEYPHECARLLEEFLEGAELADERRA